MSKQKLPFVKRNGGRIDLNSFSFANPAGVRPGAAMVRPVPVRTRILSKAAIKARRDAAIEEARKALENAIAEWEIAQLRTGAARLH